MYFNFNRRGLRVGFCIIGGLCISLPLFRCSDLGVRASAASVVPVALTASQTLALYGSSIAAQYYNGSSIAVAEFNYVGSTFALSDAVQQQEKTIFYSSSNDENPVENVSYGTSGFYSPNVLSAVQGLEYLIYKFDVANLPSAGTFDFQIRLEQSLNITCGGFATSIWWSNSDVGFVSRLGNNSSSFSVYGYDVTNLLGSFTGLPSYRYFDSFYGKLKFPVLESTMNMTVNGVTESFGHYQDSNTSIRMYTASAVAGNRIDDSTSPISIGGILCNIRGASVVTVPQVVNSVNGSVTYTDFTAPAVYLLIQCPLLYGDFVLPAPDQPDSPVDLTNIEGSLSAIQLSNDDILAILRLLQSDTAHISDNSFVHTNQLIDVISKLNQIAASMPDLSSFDVPTVTDAPQIAIDSNVDRRISSDLASGVEHYPDITEFDTDKLSSFGDFLGRIRAWFPVELVSLGALTIALSFVTWFLFRGRGS